MTPAHDASRVAWRGHLREADGSSSGSTAAPRADRRDQVLDDGLRYQTVVMPNGYTQTMHPVFHGFTIARCR